MATKKSIIKDREGNLTTMTKVEIINLDGSTTEYYLPAELAALVN